MKITGISVQAKNPNRVNVSVDGKYRFSLDIYQLADLGIKQGQEITDDNLELLENESIFGKLYARALEFTLSRPHSAREICDYLRRKTRTTKYRHRQTGQVKERAGVPQSITERVFEQLQQKGYIDDLAFTRFWIENRHQVKGISRRKLRLELQSKGIERDIVDRLMMESSRNDDDEIAKIIAKKRSKYDDPQKLMSYLARQGFSYDDIKEALAKDADLD